MKVPLDWLKELVEIKDIKEVIDLLPLRTIGTKEITPEFIELDMKGYNRADLLSLRGVAYEVAAIIDSSVKFDELDENGYIWAGKQLTKLAVEVEDEKLCPVYCLAKIEGLKVGSSDKDWIKKLKDSGYRTVNNIADITNLIMLEYGQPLHAFDTKAVENEKIVVRSAKLGEKITTLDGKDRTLEKADLLITDPKKVLGIAGVMGGKNSEVPDSGEVAILLEAAIFDPASLRNTSTRLGLPSEASKRFYHGLTKKRLFQALDKAIRTYQDLGGKFTGLTIVGNTRDRVEKVPLSLSRTNQLIGVDLNKQEIEGFLKKLNFELEEQENAEGDPAWAVTPPYYRLDVNIEEDLIEEVARMYGYERIAAKQLLGGKSASIDQSLFNLISNLKQKLIALGLTEVQTYSFFSSKVLDALNFDNQTKNVLIKVANPISSETEYMRMNIWPNLVEVIDKNLRQGFLDIAIFEIGKEYTIVRGKTVENYSLAVALMNGTDNPLGELNQIFNKIFNSRAEPVPESRQKILKLVSSSGALSVQDDISVEAGKPPEVIGHLFHPHRYLSLNKGKERVGEVAEIHQRVLDKFGISKRVAILQIDLRI